MITLTPTRDLWRKKSEHPKSRLPIALMFSLMLIIQFYTQYLTVNAGYEVTWEQYYGQGYVFCVQPTNDGGYVLVGRRDEKVLLIKTDPEGNETWEKEIGGEHWYSGYSVKQTSDGGFIVSGRAYEPRLFDNSTKHHVLIYLIKTDSEGEVSWEKTFGGAENDYGRTVEETDDGGYMLVGYTEGVQPSASIIKTDLDGVTQWTIKGANLSSPVSEAWDVQQTDDNGYIVTGGLQIYLLKINENGAIDWLQKYDGYNGRSVRQTTDGGFVVLGVETHKINESNGGALLIKTDDTGKIVWSKTYGSTNIDVGRNLQLTNDGGFIIIYSHQDSSSYLIKTDEFGEVLWQREMKGIGYYVLETTDDCYIVSGCMESGEGIFMSKYEYQDAPEITEEKQEEEKIAAEEKRAEVTAPETEETSVDETIEQNELSTYRSYVLSIIALICLLYVIYTNTN